MSVQQRVLTTRRRRRRGPRGRRRSGGSRHPHGDPAEGRGAPVDQPGGGAARPGRPLGPGVAFGTPDEAHLLNVPASGMSAFPEDPADFAWNAGHDPVGDAGPSAFLPRRRFALYLDDLTADRRVHRWRRVPAPRAGERHGRSSYGGPADRPHQRRTRPRRRRRGGRHRTAAGRAPVGSALAARVRVLRRRSLAARSPRRGPPRPGRATRCPAGRHRSHHGRRRPLALGPGLRPGRVLHAVSRSGRLPKATSVLSSWRPSRTSPSGAPPWTRSRSRRDNTSWGGPRQRGLAPGHRRSPVPGLLAVGAAQRCRPRRVPRPDAGRWNVLRHRMAPSSAAFTRELRGAGRLTVASAEVADARPLPRGGVEVTLTDGTVRAVGWVVNCTGPQADVRLLGDPLLDDLLARRAGVAIATTATAGMGFRTDRGRLRDSAGSTEAPIWALGALRRGELWESTAVPEIRSQPPPWPPPCSTSCAAAPPTGGRPRGERPPSGRPAPGPAGPAVVHHRGGRGDVQRGARTRDAAPVGRGGAHRDATLIDPDFALAHAALAMLGYEAGGDADVQTSLGAAQQAVRRRGDARESSFVDVVARRVNDVRRVGARALMAHIAGHPRDVLAVSAAVPTIAFSGVTDVQRESWDLVEGLALPTATTGGTSPCSPSPVRTRVGSTRPGCSPRVRCRANRRRVMPCTPRPTSCTRRGSTSPDASGWTTGWPRAAVRPATGPTSRGMPPCELALGDTEAVRRRYLPARAPGGHRRAGADRLRVPAVALAGHHRGLGSRRRHGVVAATRVRRGGPPPPFRPVLDAVDPAMLLRPQTPFVAVHAAMALAGAGELEQLESLRRHCAGDDPTLRTVVATVCTALGAVVEAVGRGGHDADRGPARPGPGGWVCGPAGGARGDVAVLPRQRRCRGRRPRAPRDSSGPTGLAPGPATPGIDGERSTLTTA